MLSRILRRTHMYLALFLTPWVLMYALSTVVMNHRGHLRRVYGETPPIFSMESERDYAAIFPANATPQQKAIQILRDLNLEGAYAVSRPAPDGTLTINRQDPVTPKRIRYRPTDKKITVERLEYRTPAFLERMHRRRGYDHGYAADDGWAVSVDLFIVAMVFWVASGLWMWWEMRLTRRTGALFACAGLALFAVFLVTI